MKVPFWLPHELLSTIEGVCGNDVFTQDSLPAEALAHIQKTSNCLGWLPKALWTVG